MQPSGDTGPVGPRLILGLGNPGPEYRDTRHNVGFEVIDELARRRRTRADRLECNTLLAHEPDLLLGKPLTYMNRSGYAAACLAERHRVGAESMLVVVDDVSLPVGRLRLRRQGSPGGHRGLESVVESLKTDRVARLRLGIREGEESPTGDELVTFVLEPFGEAERRSVRDMVERAADACEAWLEDGIDSAMNRFNC